MVKTATGVICPCMPRMLTMHHFLIAVIASGSVSAIVTAGIAWRWGLGDMMTGG